jgi:hypothetical protein
MSAARASGSWRKHVDPDGYAFGGLLLLILVSVGFQLTGPDEEWSRMVMIALQGATLLAALHVSHAQRWLIRLVTVLAAVAVLGTAGVLIGSGELDDAAGRSIGLMLVLLAPPAIIAGMVRQARASGLITVRTMFAVLCIYLLLGMAFGYAYGLVSAVSDDPFFAEISGGDQAQFLYYSFVTLTTTGFGDLTAAQDVGRSLTVMEALIGQIYLVTVVALIVSNLGRSQRPAA